MRVHGVLLAAGAGRRMGMPKALVEDEGGAWLGRGVAALAAGGCDGVTVVLGAAAPQAVALLDRLLEASDGGVGRADGGVDGGVDGEVDIVLAPDWESGMSASLRAGLRALPPEAEAALVHLVDLPDVGSGVVARVLAAVAGPDALARASYGGTPGHPVLLGRDHVAAVLAGARGDAGARDYLRKHEALLVECGDLASGRDVDTPSSATGARESRASRAPGRMSEHEDEQVERGQQQDGQQQDGQREDGQQDAQDQDAGEASRPTGAAAAGTTGEEADPDAGPASAPQ